MTKSSSGARLCSMDTGGPNHCAMATCCCTSQWGFTPICHSFQTLHVLTTEQNRSKRDEVSFSVQWCSAAATCLLWRLVWPCVWKWLRKDTTLGGQSLKVTSAVDSLWPCGPNSFEAPPRRTAVATAEPASAAKCNALRWSIVRAASEEEIICPGTWHAKFNKQAWSRNTVFRHWGQHNISLLWQEQLDLKVAPAVEQAGLWLVSLEVDEYYHICTADCVKTKSRSRLGNWSGLGCKTCGFTIVWLRLE